MPVNLVRKLDLLDEERAKATWTRFESGPAIFPALSHGDIDIAMMGAGAAITAMSNGLDVRIVGVSQVISANEGLVAHPESGIQDVSDLDGKKIGVSVGSSGYMGLINLLEKDGMTLDDVEIVNIGFAQTLPAFSSGDIDAAFIPEPFRSRLVDEGGRILITTAEIGSVPAEMASTTVWLARTEFAETDAEALEAFLQANEDARIRWIEGGDEVDRALSEVATELETDSAQARVLATAVEYPSLLELVGSDEFYAFGSDDVSVSNLVRSLRELAEIQVGFGQLKSVPDIASFVDAHAVQSLADTSDTN